MDLLLAIFHLFRNQGRKPLSLLSRSGIRLQARDGTGEKLRFTLYLPQEQVEETGGDRFRRTASTTTKSARAATERRKLPSLTYELNPKRGGSSFGPEMRRRLMSVCVASLAQEMSTRFPENSTAIRD